MSLIAHIRGRSIERQSRERAGAYGVDWSGEQRLAWQLGRINELWTEQQQRIPAYIDSVASGGLPRAFGSVQEFVERFPATTKKMVQTDMDRLSDPSRPADFTFTTGGSTGEPTKIPFWNSEHFHSIPDRWMCRAWYGVRPSDRLFMIWGHSHLLGTGLKGWLNGRWRGLKDSMLGYRRFSAYQLDPAKLRAACDEMLAYRPRYVIGYSAALGYFCRVNADRAAELHALKLRMAVGTGESFPFEDSVQVINRTLGCPVAMEYGSVETSIMGFSRPATVGMGWFDLFWRSFFFEAGEPGPSGGRVIRVTSLFPKKFPLLRYEIGDEVTLVGNDSPLGLARVQQIVGKTLSFVTLADGTKVHSVAFEHSVRTVPGVERFQLISKAGDISLRVVAPTADKAKATAAIQTMMHRIHPSLATARIEFTDQLIQTVAGKTPMVIMDESHLGKGMTEKAQFGGSIASPGS